MKIRKNFFVLAFIMLFSVFFNSCGENNKSGDGTSDVVETESSADSTSISDTAESGEYTDYIKKDGEYINKDTLSYYCVSNEIFIKPETKVTGIVLEFPGLGGHSCLGGNMDNMFAYSSDFAKECAKKGIVLAYTFPGPWSWMNKGAVRVIDLIVDAYMDKYAWSDEEDFTLTVMGGSMGGQGALIYTIDSRHTVDACVAHCPCYNVLECFSNQQSFPRAFISAVNAYDMPLEEALKLISPEHRIDEMPDIPYIVTGDELDDCFPIKGTENFVSQMKEANLDVQYMFLEGQQHGGLSGEDRNTIEQFIFKYSKVSE